MSWPADGEIDILEHVGYDPNVVHGTIHCSKYNHMIGTQKGNSIKVNDVFNFYHTYTLEWSPYRIDIFVDGVKYFSYSKESTDYASWPFDNYHNIILNTAVGGDWGGVMGVDDSVFPVNYRIDYVRQYEWIPDTPATVSRVSKAQIKAVANGKFVTVNGAGNLIASQTVAGNSETFEIAFFADGYVSMKSMANQKYVKASNDPLTADAAVLDDWELFFIQGNNDGTYSFRAKFNWQYVCADNYGNNPLIANRYTNSGWENFNLVWVA